MKAIEQEMTPSDRKLILDQLSDIQRKIDTIANALYAVQESVKKFDEIAESFDPAAIANMMGALMGNGR